MKMQPSDLQMFKKLEELSPQMGGVFSIADLSNLFGTNSILAKQRSIKRLVKEGILSRCQRGLYVTQNFDAWVLATRLAPEDSYISMDSVLAKNGLIGTLPAARVSVVTLSRNRVVQARKTRIQFCSIAPELFFGFSLKQGARIADNEKAYLDLLYYYLRGYPYPIDPRSEVALDRLDQKKVRKYLGSYKNPKFVSFVKKLLGK